MAIPSYDELMLPLLKELDDGQEQQNRDLREALARELGLTEAELAQRAAGGNQPVFSNRWSWAKIYLDRAGLLKSPRRGWCQITDAGRKVLASNPSAIDRTFLLQFESFQAFAGKGKEGEATLVTPDGAAAGPLTTPEEALARAHAEIRSKVETDLLDAVGKASPAFFEKLVVELLVKMGYGGTLEDAGRALGRSHDGGVDGIIKEDHLGLDAIYVQAKRWQASVGRPDVQAFAGSLEGERARKGVFLTTSSFTAEARDYVRKIEKKIVLIDGRQLTGLMVDFGIGVNTVTSYEVTRVDSDYFTEE